MSVVGTGEGPSIPRAGSDQSISVAEAIVNAESPVQALLETPEEAKKEAQRAVDERMRQLFIRCEEFLARQRESTFLENDVAKPWDPYATYRLLTAELPSE